MSSPSIAVLGSGGVGGTLAARWAKSGHTVLLGTRNPADEKMRVLLEQCGPRAKASDWRTAVQGAEVVLLSVPWRAVRDVLAACGDLKGKILIDCVNPLTPDIKALTLGHTTSAAEEIASLTPGARVVKAFNTVGVKTMANPVYNGEAATLFYCGDDKEAKRVVHTLAAELGFDPLDAGPLRIARLLEPLAMLYIHLAVHEQMGSRLAFKLLRRS